MNILVTGGAGFIGSNFIQLLVEQLPDVQITNLDKLTYAGHPSTVQRFNSLANYQFVHGDITNQSLVNKILATGIEYIVNFAAESHVDRSIDSPSVFIETNIVGTQVLLQAASKHKVKRFIQISTDEVYGSLQDTGQFSEYSPLDPSSPYSASKTSADLLALAWHRTYGLHVNITRCSNNYGPYQFPEKLIPVIIERALSGGTIPVYGDGSNVRDWIHVQDHCRAILAVLLRGTEGRIYNIGANNEQNNLQIVKTILDILDYPHSRIQFVTDRPGHDWRYAVDASRLRNELSWSPKVTFNVGLMQTIQWYEKNEWWWKPLLGKK